MLFGTNNAAFPQVSANTSGLTAYRAYNGPGVGVPAVFPGPKVTVPNGTVPVISFKPRVPDVLTGNLDSQLNDFFLSAPSGAWVTAWHEGNLPNHNFTPQEHIALSVYLRYLAKKANPGVRYGQIFGCFQVITGNQDLGDWVAPGMDFYGIDCYQEQPTWTADLVVTTPLAQIWSAVDHIADLAVIETNSAADPVAWLPEAYAAAQAANCRAFLPFFNATSGIPYAYQSSYGPVMASLATEAAQF